MNDDFGCFFGSGTTRPQAVRWRAMVARETVMSCWCFRCQQIVSGPASRPVADSFSRSSTIRSTTSVGVALGLPTRAPRTGFKGRLAVAAVPGSS